MREQSWLRLEEVKRIVGEMPMPENFYRAEHVDGLENDGLWIHQQLSQLTYPQRIKAATAYDEAYTPETRADCNRRLLRFVKRVVDINKGKTWSLS